MKKRILLISCCLLAAVVLFFIAYKWWPIHDDAGGNDEIISADEKEQASDETFLLAKRIIDEQAKLRIIASEPVDFPELNYLYYKACTAFPETKLLETKEDAVLAMLQYYEQILESVSLDDFIMKEKERRESSTIDGYVYSDEYINITDAIAKLSTIEGFMALEYYYDQLDEKNLTRFLADLSLYADYYYGAYVELGTYQMDWIIWEPKSVDFYFYRIMLPHVPEDDSEEIE